MDGHRCLPHSLYLHIANDDETQQAPPNEQKRTSESTPRTKRVPQIQIIFPYPFGRCVCACVGWGTPLRSPKNQDSPTHTNRKPTGSGFYSTKQICGLRNNGPLFLLPSERRPQYQPVVVGSMEKRVRKQLFAFVCSVHCGGDLF